MLYCIGVIIDCLWKTRNRITHSSNSNPCVNSVRKEISSKFFKLCKDVDGDTLMNSVQLSTTNPPRLSTDKCILGSSEWWRCSSTSLCDSALEAEMQAVMLGLQWASLNHWNNLSIISDSMVLMEAIRAKKSAELESARICHVEWQNFKGKEFLPVNLDSFWL
ncbi:hypothetical protein G4B88_008103 [Cannabis sativa]|uniref:RNase H type-1 domain-containing protein n=1 Tax=Cannabis sativa TaxID=3483 RepID=A0A7J6I7B9_CANSA|nr:hypothetical protein G4B88_008103 [Cannabis sativa]